MTRRKSVARRFWEAAWLPCEMDYMRMICLGCARDMRSSVGRFPEKQKEPRHP